MEANISTVLLYLIYVKIIDVFLSIKKIAIIINPHTQNGGMGEEGRI